MARWTKQDEREHLENCMPEVQDFVMELIDKKPVEYVEGDPTEWRKKFEDKRPTKVVE